MVPESRMLKNYHRVTTAFLIVRLVAFFGGAPMALAKEPVTHLSRQVSAQSVNLEYLSNNDFLSLTNQVRISYGVAPLKANNQLTVAAQAKIIDMVEKGYWEHFRPSDHKAPWDFIKEAGYSYTVAGENLAKGFRTPQGITKAWAASPTHLANIISPKYSEVGFASTQVIQPDGTEYILTVEMFGHR